MSNQITMLETLRDALKTAGKFAAKTWAPKLTDLAGSYSQNIKTVLRSFNQPKAALDDLFKQNPDTFRDCKLVKLIKDSAAGVVTEAAAPYGGTGSFPEPGLEMGRLSVPPPARPMGRPARVEPEDEPTATTSSKNNKFKGSYKAIFEGYVKGNAANSPLQYSKNFSVTIKPNNASTDGDLKYVADRVIFKDDREFTDVNESVNPAETNYFNLFKIDILKNKFILNREPNFYPLGNVQKGNPSKGTKLNFDGTVTFTGKPARPIADDEYIIYKNNSGRLQSDGKLYKGTREINESVNINYSQKNILINSEKLVDLFYK